MRPPRGVSHQDHKPYRDQTPPPPGRAVQTMGPGASRFQRWSVLRPGQSMFWFPTLVATLWALVIAVFVAVSVVFETDDGASWGEAAGAVAGNFVVVWVVAFVVSAAIRLGARR